MQQRYIRLAEERDFEEIAKMAALALLADPLLTYFGCGGEDCGKSTDGLEAYIVYVLNCVSLVGGQVYVACTRSASDLGPGQVVAVAAWTPPERYYNAWDPITMTRAGILSLATTHGLQSIRRIAWDYPTISQQSWLQSSYCLDSTTRRKRDLSWGLKLAATDPRFQKKGIMTSLIKAHMDCTPHTACYVQVANPHAREYFSKFGFELLDRRRVGEGSVDDQGRVELNGSGFEVHSMVHWNH